MALTVVLLFAGYLLVLAWMSWFAPQLAGRFLSGFVSSWRIHWLEMGLRLVAGLALYQLAPHMLFGSFFSALAAMIMGTSIVLLVLPWTWHRSFAARVMPGVLSHLKLFGFGSLVLAVFLLASIALGSSAAAS